jgi:GT2 family glycosyltransferase
MNGKSQQSENVLRPFVSLSIVSHGDAGKIERLLDSLQRYERANRFQVIITDNLGDDVPEIKGPEWQSLHIIRNKKPLGFARNHNQAFQLTAGKYFCVLNPDVLFEQEVFLPLIKCLENGQADIIAPLIVDESAVPQDSFRNFPTPVEIIRRRLPGYRFMPPATDNAGLVRPDWVAGIFMLMKSRTYEKIKGFDEKYRLYFEDVDFCARARLAGLKLIVDTNIRVRHDAHRASRKKFIYLFWHIQSAIRFFSSPIYKQVFQRRK